MEERSDAATLILAFSLSPSRFLNLQSFAILSALSKFNFIGNLIGRIMAMKCQYCGKAPSYGNVVSHANNTRRRRWNPNLKSVRAVVSGAHIRVKVCTACIRAGKVKKAA